ncbi:MAG: hypothetical protein AAFR52_02820 [Pseudomonadota bacterium]
MTCVISFDATRPAALAASPLHRAESGAFGRQDPLLGAARPSQRPPLSQGADQRMLDRMMAMLTDFAGIDMPATTARPTADIVTLRPVRTAVPGIAGAPIHDRTDDGRLIA